MVKGKLSNGFEFEVKDHIKKDYSLIIQYSKYKKDPEDFTEFDKMLTMILGEEQRTAFVESFMDDEGIVRSDYLFDGFKEMMGLISEKDDDLKN